VRDFCNAVNGGKYTTALDIGHAQGLLTGGLSDWKNDDKNSKMLRGVVIIISCRFI
jgi:hypothetical protein